MLDTDLDRARTTARTMLGMYLQLPNYTANLLRLGFTEGDFDGGGSVRLLDALFALGDAEQVTRRTQEYLDAGADHVALQVLTADEGGGGPLSRRMAAAGRRLRQGTLTGCGRAPQRAHIRRRTPRRLLALPRRSLRQHRALAVPSG